MISPTNDILNLHMTASPLAITALITFIVAYIFIITEEFTLLRKSKPAVLLAGVIWVLVAIVAHSKGLSDSATIAVKNTLLEYGELLLFLLVAMTYVSSLEERNVFESLKGWLIRKRFSYRQVFWICGILAFFLSPMIDNLTTALVMCAVVLTLGKDEPRFVAASCVNIVVAANAGGSFSPFGDITTLMVWQKGILPFADFFKLFLPAVVNFIVPAVCIHFTVPKKLPPLVEAQTEIKEGGIVVICLFLLTIATTVGFHHFLSLPPAVGMMTGLAYLQFFSYSLKRKYINGSSVDEKIDLSFDFFYRLHRIEWDTLLFFYGIMLAIGGLAVFGYLELTSNFLYGEWGEAFNGTHRHTPGNLIIGVLSSIVDNIPLMYAVLTMKPTMSEGQWLLITLTTGVGGSLLSIGSAAGVALMGQSKGLYTFFSHLKWTWAILLGYIGAIFVHLVLNQSLF